MLAPMPAGGNAVSFDGQWDLTINSPMGAKVFRLDIRTVDGRIQGTSSTSGETPPRADPVLLDGHLRWSMKMPRPMNVVLEVDLVRDGDVLAGSAKAGHMVLDQVRGVKTP